jgi:hypothetical protein
VYHVGFFSPADSGHGMLEWTLRADKFSCLQETAAAADKKLGIRFSLAHLRTDLFPSVWQYA